MKFLQAVVLVCLCSVPSIADNFLVLPFFNLEKSNSLDWVGESISEAIREALASEGVLTLERDAREEAFRRLSVKPYTPLTTASVIRLAESVDADQVIFGSFEVIPAPTQSGIAAEGLRYTAHQRASHRSEEGPAWTEYSGRGAARTFASLQSHLAWQTLEFVLDDRRPTEAQFRARQSLVRVDAIESYVRGLARGLRRSKAEVLHTSAPPGSEVLAREL